jgi:hypothetical protein
MKKSEMKALAHHTMDLEDHINTVMRKILTQHGEDVAMNVLLNVGTSMLAKTLLLAPEEARDDLVGVLATLIDAKVKEGNAMIESVKVIGNAMVH